MQKLPEHYQKEALKKSVAALAHAVTGRVNCDIIFVTGDSRAVGDKIYLAEPVSFSHHDITLWRGYIDRALFKIAFHDVVTAQKYAPDHPDSAMLYAHLMQLRYEMCGIQNFPGAIKNISAIYHKNKLDVYNAPDKGLAQILSILCPHFLQDHIIQDIPHKQLGLINQLAASLLDIVSYAELAAEYAQLLCDLTDNQQCDAAGGSEFSADGFHKDQDLTPIDQTISNQDTTTNDQTDSTPDDDTDNQLSAMSDEMMSIMQDMQTDDALEACEQVSFIDEAAFKDSFHHSDYKVFTRQHDQVTAAEALVKASDLDMLHDNLLRAKKDHAKVIQKLSRKLRARLVSFKDDSYHQDLYQGRLDHHKITKILTDPFDGRFFKEDNPFIAENTAVTILIDNSGSMRGKPITMAALCANIIAETIELCGAKVEILGFTTKGWRGGDSRKTYEKAGCPPMPGRLNDLQHIIYKDFNMSSKKAARSIAVMLKESILKENIDGEALLWAADRLIKRPEKRRILTIISDGAPVDDSTSSANHHDFLESHLRHVIHYFENKSPIDIFALGIGHDVQNYYKKSVTVPNSDEIATALTEKFVRLF